MDRNYVNLVKNIILRQLLLYSHSWVLENKLYTDQEHALMKGFVFPLILAEGYSDYVAQLEEINQNCTAAYDLRYIFDDYLGTIYWDYVHVKNRGNEIVAKVFYEIINDHIKK